LKELEEISFFQTVFKTRVADADLGSSAFLTPGMEKKSSSIFKNIVLLYWVKNIKNV
jgi:hypothetical protein